MPILSKAFNVAVNHIASRILPMSYDIAGNAPNNYESLVRHYEKTGRILVWNGASDKTIFGCNETNFAFRAWHDSKHILYKLPFDFSGEFAAYLEQCKDIRKLYGFGDSGNLFCSILYAEIVGQFDYQGINGEFPVNQYDFVKDYLTESGTESLFRKY